MAKKHLTKHQEQQLFRAAYKRTAAMTTTQLLLDSIVRAWIIAILVVIFAVLVDLVSGITNIVYYTITYFIAGFMINMTISLAERSMSRRKLEKKS